MKACIIYNSKHGTTKAYAEEIGKALKEKGIENQIFSIADYKKDYLQTADIILLGCWTHGLMFFAQHPEKAWKDFAKQMPGIKAKKLGLFTTYKLATGSMFRKMEVCLKDKADASQLMLRSKNGQLSEESAKQLGQFIQI